MPPDGFHHFIECHLTKVFYKMRCLPAMDFTHGRQEGPCFSDILIINVVIVIIDCIDRKG
jgi:hypothetical protein